MSRGIFHAVCVVVVFSAILRARVGVAEPTHPLSSIAITPGKIDFGSQAVGTNSRPSSATLTNVSSAGVTISDISASGIDFTETNDCPRNLPPGANCEIEVTFTPVVNGPRLGTIIVSGSDPAGPRFLVVGGIGQ